MATCSLNDIRKVVATFKPLAAPSAPGTTAKGNFAITCCARYASHPRLLQLNFIHLQLILPPLRNHQPLHCISRELQLNSSAMPPRRQATTSVRPPSQRSTRASTLPVASSPADGTVASASPDELAIQMAARLTLGKGKGKERPDSPPPAVERIRRPAARLRSTKIGSQEVKPEELAKTVEKKLKITSPGGHVAVTREERCADAMRSVNAASKTLSGIVETGWRASSQTGTPPQPAARKTNSASMTDTASQVQKLAGSLQVGLGLLRELRPGDIDVERAASSAVGKLISLEAVSP